MFFLGDARRDDSSKLSAAQVITRAIINQLSKTSLLAFLASPSYARLSPSKLFINLRTDGNLSTSA